MTSIWKTNDSSLPLAMSSGAFYPWLPTEDALEETARRGLQQVELMLQSNDEYETAFFHEIALRSAATGVKVHAVHTREQAHPLLAPYRRRADEGRTLFSRAIAGAAHVGAGVVVWHGPCQASDSSQVDEPRLREIIASLASECAAHGVRLAIENTSRCLLPGFRQVRRISRVLSEMPNGEAVGFAFDPFQAVEAGANPFMLLRAMSDRLLDVHISDIREADEERRRLLPGDGDIPWSALMRAIANTSYTGPLVLEATLPVVSGDEIATVQQLLAIPMPTGSDWCAEPLPTGVIEGIRLFNDRQFYECHEVIEHEWHAETGQIRRLYQGILQIGVGFHHARNGNYVGAEALLSDGIEKVAAFLPTCGGIDTNRLVNESQIWLERIIDVDAAQLASTDWRDVPLIYFTNGATVS